MRELAPAIVLLGTGVRQRFPHLRLYQSLTAAAIGVEVMDSGAARGPTTSSRPRAGAWPPRSSSPETGVRLPFRKSWGQTPISRPANRNWGHTPISRPANCDRTQSSRAPTRFVPAGPRARAPRAVRARRQRGRIGRRPTPTRSGWHRGSRGSPVRQPAG
ncbi:MAG: hypothetical protein MZW92_70570 [Comamonadaceae bacterium]|nr:hypothetical protein [Comamonadaceae bacterium]